MHSELDAEAFLECVSAVETPDEIDDDVETKATLIITELLSENRIADLKETTRHPNRFLTTLKNSRIVPSKDPVTHKKRLFRFSECVSDDYGYLVPFSMPVLPRKWTPGLLERGDLGFVVPPSVDNVLKSWNNTTEVALSGYHEKQSYSRNFERTLQHLNSRLKDNHRSFAKKVNSEATFIPITDTIVAAPVNCFLRPSKQLPPFMYKAPYEDNTETQEMLTNLLGVRRNLKPEHWHRVLEVAHRKGNKLSITELNSVVKILSTLSEAGLVVNYVPSHLGVLEEKRNCIYNDAPWISDRIDIKNIRLIHPKIDRQLCRKLQVTPMRVVITERLTETPVPVSDQNLIDMAKKLESNIKSKEFSDCIHRLVTVEQPQQEIKSSLSRCSITFVENLKTGFFRGKTNDNIAKQESAQSLFFISKSDSKGDVPTEMFISIKHKEEGYGIGSIVACCIKDFLKLDTIPPCLSEFVTAEPEKMISILNTLHIPPTSTVDVNVTRGVPGVRLSEEDLQNSKFGTTRQHCPGECLGLEVRTTKEVIYCEIAHVHIPKNESEYWSYDVRISEGVIKTVPATELLVIPQASSSSIPECQSIKTNGEEHQTELEEEDVVKDMLSQLLYKLDLNIDVSDIQGGNIQKFTNDLYAKSKKLEEANKKIVSLEDECDKVSYLTRCPICYCVDSKVAEDEDAIQLATLGCGHLCCTTCIQKIDKCPKCKKQIENHIVMYF